LWTSQPPARRALALEAALALAGFRLALALVPFRRIAGRLGTLGAESPATVDPGQDALALEVQWAVAAAGRRLPWPSRCLVRALAGWWMLRRRGIPTTLHFGVAEAGEGPIQAHAWLRCGTRMVCGGEERERFRTIARFAPPCG
jgi:hypothetical protein